MEGHARSADVRLRKYLGQSAFEKLELGKAGTQQDQSSKMGNGGATRARL